MKSHYVRYNAKGDNLETAFGFNGRKPVGYGWIKIEGGKCCEDLILCSEADRTFVSEDAALVAAVSYTVTFKHGADTIALENDTTLQAVVDTLNAAYSGFAVFSITADDKVQVITQACDTFSVVLQSVEV